MLCIPRQSFYLDVRCRALSVLHCDLSCEEMTLTQSIRNGGRLLLQMPNALDRALRIATQE